MDAERRNHGYYRPGRLVCVSCLMDDALRFRTYDGLSSVSNCRKGRELEVQLEQSAPGHKVSRTIRASSERFQ